MMKLKIKIHKGMTDSNGENNVVIIEPVRKTEANKEYAHWAVQFSSACVGNGKHGWLKYPAHEGPMFVHCDSIILAMEYADEYYRTGFKSGSVIE